VVPEAPFDAAPFHAAPFDVDGPVAWREAGDGEVVVLLHGLGGSRTAWEPQLAALSTRWRAVAWDLPGYGASAPLTGPLTFDRLADAVAGLLDATGTDAAHVVGLSFGGMIAQHAALRLPARVRSLALLATSPAFGLDGTTAEAWRAGRLAPLDAGRTPADIAPDVIDTIAGPALGAQARSGQIAAMSRITADALRDAIACLPTHDTRDRLAQVTAPTLVLTGELDTETPPSYGRALAGAIPQARFEVVPGAGHLLPAEVPDVVNLALAEHLAAVEQDGR
jgi:pimeloyl-ACP methyl ester carboxylesterase